MMHKKRNAVRVPFFVQANFSGNLINLGKYI